MVYNFFDKETKGSSIIKLPNKSAITQNQQLAEKLYKPIINKLRKEEFIQHLKIIIGVLIWLMCTL